MDKDYITISEYARLTGVTRQAVYNKIKSGTLADYTVTVTVNNREITALRREILKRNSNTVNSNVTDNVNLHVTQSRIDELQRQIEEYKNRELHYIRQIEEQQELIKQQQDTIQQQVTLLGNGQLIEAQRVHLQIQSRSNSGIETECISNAGSGSRTDTVKRLFKELFRRE